METNDGKADPDFVAIAESLFDNPEIGAVITGHEAATDAKGKRKPQKVFRVTPFNELMAMIDLAIAEGRHSAPGTWRTLCPQCYEMVEGMFHANPQNHKDVCCLKCAAKAGIETAIAELARQRQREEAAREYDALGDVESLPQQSDGNEDIPF